MLAGGSGQIERATMEFGSMAPAGNIEGTSHGTYPPAAEPGASRAAARVEASASDSDAAPSRAAPRPSAFMTDPECG